MKATSVSYARLYNLGNYENERFEATVQLQAGDLVDDAYNMAQDLVQGQHARCEGILHEREALEARTKRLAEEYARLQEHIVRIARSLPTNTELGESVREALESADIPF
jgi:archaellum component FlaC